MTTRVDLPDDVGARAWEILEALDHFGELWMGLCLGCGNLYISKAAKTSTICVDPDCCRVVELDHIDRGDGDVLRRVYRYANGGVPGRQLQTGDTTWHQK